MGIYKDNTIRNEEFEKLVVMTQKEMSEYLYKLMIEKYGNEGVIIDDGYIYKAGTFPVLLCAHMDTVHQHTVKTIVYANGTVSSPQGIGGDDRCGIYQILKILEKYDCHVLFLEDEEIGCVGARKFAKTKTCEIVKNNAGLKYIIEFDRKNGNDAVFYDLDNKKFEEFVTQGYFKKDFGTCSDISYLAPALNVAAVNLSCGYYHEHNIDHYVVLSEMEAVIKNAMVLLEKTKDIEDPFEWKEKPLSLTYKRYQYGGAWYDDDDYNYTSTKYEWEILYTDSNGLVACESVFAWTEDGALLSFLKENPTVCYKEIEYCEKVTKK